MLYKLPLSILAWKDWTPLPAARRQATWHGGTKGKYCQGRAHSLQTCRQADICGLLRGILQRAFGAERCLILQEAPSFLFEVTLG